MQVSFLVAKFLSMGQLSTGSQRYFGPFCHVDEDETESDVESILVAWSAALCNPGMCHHSPFVPTWQNSCMRDWLSRISPTRLPKYSPSAPLVFSKQARVHSESPIIHTLLGFTLDLEQDFRKNSNNLDNRTAPFSSDLGVEIRFRGVTLAFEQTRLASYEPSSRAQRK